MTKIVVQETPKPWGRELLWAKTSQYVGKVLEVKKGESLSLQYHKTKEETLMCESGTCVFWIGTDETHLEAHHLEPGEALHVPPGTYHRIEATSDCRLYEVSTPFLDDVVRVKDKYGREN